MFSPASSCFRLFVHLSSTFFLLPPHSPPLVPPLPPQAIVSVLSTRLSLKAEEEEGEEEDSSSHLPPPPPLRIHSRWMMRWAPEHLWMHRHRRWRRDWLEEEEMAVWRSMWPVVVVAVVVEVPLECLIPPVC